MSEELFMEMIAHAAELERRLDDLDEPSVSLPDEVAFGNAAAMYQMLPGLRGFWPMSVVGGGAQAIDISGRGLTLTYNGDPVYGVDGLAPYIDLDGTGDYLSRADESGFDILGTESYIGIPGLTIGCWFYPEDDTGNDYLLSKWGAAGQRSYVLTAVGTVGGDPLRFAMTFDGTTENAVDNAIMTYNAWNFGVGRFNDADAGEELACWVNDTKTTAASALASVKDSNADFVVGGAHGGATLLDGRISLAFLCASALSDAIIATLYRRTKAMFE